MSDVAARLDIGKGGKHHGKRFLRAPLAGAQPSHDSFVQRIDKEMKAPDSFERHDLAFAQCRGGTDQRRMVAGKRAPAQIP
jgi:hypothetical protein